MVGVEEGQRLFRKSGFGKVEGEVEDGLSVVAGGRGDADLAMPDEFDCHRGPVVERVGGEGRVEKANGLVAATEFCEDQCVQGGRLLMIAVGRERGIEVLEGPTPILSATIDGCQLIVATAAPLVVPGSLGKEGVGGVGISEKAQRESDVVVGLAADRIRMAAGEPGDGSLAMVAGDSELAAEQGTLAQSGVAAGVTRVAAQGFLPVGLRGAGGMAVLLKVFASEEELIVIRDVSRGRRFISSCMVLIRSR